MARKSFFSIRALPFVATILGGCHGPSRCAAREGTTTTTAPPPPPPLVGEPKNGAMVPTTHTIVVDQFGYLPDAAKVIVASRSGQGAADGEMASDPGPLLEVRRFSDATIVFSGAPVKWHDGAIDEASSDRGWWFDVSSVTTPGSYFVFDPSRRVRSYRFDVGADVYRDVLRAAVRMFYFNRANVAKRAPFACVKDRCWTIGESYLGKGQDASARSIRARDTNDYATARDLSGGWWDAGDVNKYVTNANTPVHQLLTAYSETPGPFGDDYGVPESGNGVPDLLDEVSVELDWLRKMQPDDLGGGVLLKVGNVGYGDPVPDESRHPRFYYPDPCSSSTIDAAGMFAHAALVFRSVPVLSSRAEELQRRAVRAFDYFESHPQSAACDDGTILAGGSDRTLPQQAQARVVAAIYLFSLTGEGKYGDAVRAGFAATRPFTQDDWSAYDPEQGDALSVYAALPNVDPAVAKTIVERFATLARSAEALSAPLDRHLYRAFMPRGFHHWGSNMVRANVGNENLDAARLHLDGLPESDRRERALGILHYLHGENPLSLAYLTNMGAYGATASVSEMFHAWFRDGDARFDSAKTSELGPAPGYLVGGPNPNYCAGQDPTLVRCAASPLRSAPPDKAFRDFNTGFEPKVEYDRSWELTEPAIYYQSAYVKLLAHFVR